MACFLKARKEWSYVTDKTSGVKYPVIGVAIENPVTGKVFPDEGEILASVDTGYEGFLLIPERVYNDMGFTLAEMEKDCWAVGETITGQEIELITAYATIKIPALKIEIKGQVETFKGNNEFIAGLSLLERLRVLLDGPRKKLVVLGVR